MDFEEFDWRASEESYWAEYGPLAVQNHYMQILFKREAAGDECFRAFCRLGIRAVVPPTLLPLQLYGLGASGDAPDLQGRNAEQSLRSRSDAGVKEFLATAKKPQ
ncbi:MAG: hypothetical protein JO323_14590 [Acidobacteriia bacterium]|nr:hypothetical protein [Terriglobia bacterium]